MCIHCSAHQPDEQQRACVDAAAFPRRFNGSGAGCQFSGSARRGSRRNQRQRIEITSDKLALQAIRTTTPVGAIS